MVFSSEQKITSSETLGYPDPQSSFILYTDASNLGIGAILSQRQMYQGDLVERPIAYASRTLTKSERRYCVTRRELLSAVYFIKYLRHYLYGRTFKLRVDHAALRWITLSTREPEGKIAHWIETLDTYQFKIEHRPGQDIPTRTRYQGGHVNSAD